MLRLAYVRFSSTGLKICYFGTYSSGEGYPVNRVLIEGLRRAGATVWECRAGVAGDGNTERWKAGRGLFAIIGLAVRWAWAWCGLTARWITGPPTDVVIVGYLGHVDVLLARALTRRPVDTSRPRLARRLGRCVIRASICGTRCAPVRSPPAARRASR